MDGQIIMDNFQKRLLFVRVARLESTDGFLVHPKHLRVRELNRTGVVKRYIPGHGGDCWFVQHNNQDIGAYSYTELELDGELSANSD